MTYSKNNLNSKVVIGQILELEIEKLVQGGEGLGKYQDFTIFVPQGLIGDKVEIEIISTKPSYARGIIKNIIEPSKFRIKPPCPVTKECGGCQWQDLEYKVQLETKENLLIENLIRIGNLSEENIEQAHEKIIGMENPFYYRNKSQFPFVKEDKKIKGGFYSKHSHNIVEFEKCYIQSDPINFVFRKVRDLLRKYDIDIYDEKKNKGIFRHLVVRHAFTSNQILVGFVTKSGKIPHIKEIVSEIKKDFPEVVGIVQNINDQKTNVILGEKNINLFGQDYIIEQINELKFKISLHSFFQVNPIQTVHLYNKVLEYADLKGDENVLDAYAGAGTISLWMARYAKKVFGIEVVKEAVLDGIENAKINNIDNFFFKEGKVEEKLPVVLRKNDIDIVILDPPRKGCEDYIFDTIAEHNIEKIIYVSCNPSTLARDAKLICESGYKLEKFQPVDMFPHTYHLETVCLFTKISEPE